MHASLLWKPHFIRCGFSGLDVLVHAAGIDVFAPIMDLKMEDAERVMKLNYFIPLELTKAALPHLRKTKGNVIFITSAICEKATML